MARSLTLVARQSKGGRGLETSLETVRHGRDTSSAQGGRCRHIDQMVKNLKSVKSADRPDSVQPRALRRGAVTAIPLGRLSPERLGATYPHTTPGQGQNDTA